MEFGQSYKDTELTLRYRRVAWVGYVWKNERDPKTVTQWEKDH